MAEWIETDDHMPEEDAGLLEFSDGQRVFVGYFKNELFIEELPASIETGAATEWAPSGITQWRTKGDEKG